MSEFHLVRRQRWGGVEYEFFQHPSITSHFNIGDTPWNFSIQVIAEFFLQGATIPSVPITVRRLGTRVQPSKREGEEPNRMDVLQVVLPEDCKKEYFSKIQNEVLFWVRGRGLITATHFVPMDQDVLPQNTIERVNKQPYCELLNRMYILIK
jgi:hypothetical protein